MSKEYKHKRSGWIAQKIEYSRSGDYRLADGNLIPKEFVEDSNDWVEITKCDNNFGCKCKNTIGNWINGECKCPKCGHNLAIKEEPKKDYEILSFYIPESSLKAEIQKDGTYKMLPRNTSIGGSTLSAMLGLNMWRIHSVKRLSDGEVFTVGDKLKGGFTISSFNFVNFGKYSDYDDLWIIKETNFKGTKKEQLTPFFYKFENQKYFSTKEAAEEYILMNKPCLSINDIDRFVREYKPGLGALKLFVKSRLNV